MTFDISTGTSLLSTIFNQTYFFSTEYILSTILVILTLLMITREFNRWKELALPVMVGWQIAGIQQSLLLWMIAAVAFALEHISLKMMGNLATTITETYAVAKHAITGKRTKDKYEQQHDRNLKWKLADQATWYKEQTKQEKKLFTQKQLWRDAATEKQQKKWRRNLQRQADDARKNLVQSNLLRIQLEQGRKTIPFTEMNKLQAMANRLETLGKHQLERVERATQEFNESLSQHTPPQYRRTKKLSDMIKDAER